MKSFNLLIYFFLCIVLFSCSSVKKTKPLRLPANSLVSRACIGLVSSIIKPREADYKSIAEKINSGGHLSLRQRAILKEHLPFIENEPDRLRLAKKIEKGRAFSHYETSLLVREILPRILKKTSASEAGKRVRLVGGDPRIPISFGLEAELLLKDNPGILQFYRLKKYTDEEWVQLAIEKRLKLSQAAIDNADAYQEILIKIEGGHEKLPPTIFVEGHKTIEANDMVFDTVFEIDDFLKWFAEHIGRASFQGHVAYKDLAKIKGVAGYIIFESDLAQLENMERGYSRYLMNQDIIPSKSLVHHSLGPLSENERLLFLVYEDSVNHKEEITERIGSSKTILGPNFRPGDPYPEGMVGFEHRQYHKRFEKLVEGLDLQSRELEISGGLSRYKGFDDTEQINDDLLEKRLKEYALESSEDDIHYMLIAAGETLEKRAEKVGMTLGGAKGENRFFFPLKDWKNHPILKGLEQEEKKEALERIYLATKSYLESLAEISKRIDVNSISDEAIVEIQVLNAKWGSEVDLSRYFSSYRKEVMNEISERGPPEFHTLPKLEGFGKKKRTFEFRNGRKANAYKIGLNSEKNRDYREVRETSVEVLFYPMASSYGHIALRVGDIVYDIGGPLSSSIKDFSIMRTKAGLKVEGYVYQLTREQVESVKESLDLFYRGSEQFNIPPFDAFGKTYEIEKSAEGKFKILRPKKYGSGKNNIMKGSLIRIGQSLFLEAPNGLKYPVIEKEGKLMIKTVSCASSARYALKDFLGLDIGNYLGAKSIRDAVHEGTIDEVPDYIFQY